MKCPFCPIEKLTEWYLVTPDNIVVCRDLNDRGYRMRVLVVGSGSFWHRPQEDYLEKEINKFIGLGIKIAKRLIKEGKARKIAEIDTTHFTIKEHFHIQICLL